MDNKDFKPFVPASVNMAELTLKAVLLGCAMAIVLGAATIRWTAWSRSRSKRTRLA